MKPTKVNYNEELSKLSKEELIRYALFLSRNFWNMQGNWMLNVTERFGTDVAAEFDALVFRRNAEVQGWRLKKTLNLGDDIQSFIKANNYSTVWNPDSDWEYTEVSERHTRFRVTKCVMQMARLGLNLPELPCKNAGMNAVERLAAAINPKFKTTCIICPPDKHPTDLWCEWLIELEE